MIQVKSFEQFIAARKRGANINVLILEMRRGGIPNEKIQEIIDIEHPGSDDYKVDMKGLKGNLKTREIDYKELYEECKARLVLMQSGGSDPTKRIFLKAKRTMEPPSGLMGELQAKLEAKNKRQKLSESTKKKMRKSKRSLRKSKRYVRKSKRSVKKSNRSLRKSKRSVKKSKRSLRNSKN